MSERQPTVEPEIPERALVTGLPGFLPMRMAAELLSRDSDTRVVAVIRAEDAELAAPLRARFPGRVDLLEGDVSAMDMQYAGHQERGHSRGRLREQCERSGKAEPGQYSSGLTHSPSHDDSNDCVLP